MKDRKFEGVWIPKVLWLTTKLKPIEKMLILEINSLDKNEKHCYARNIHFATLFDISSSTITRTLQSLEKKNIIKIDAKYTQTGVKRTIYSKLDKWLIKESANVTLTCPDKSKSVSPTSQNESHNNTSYNNTNKRDTKVSHAKKNSADDNSEQSSFTEEEFNLGEEHEENKDPSYNWIVKVTTASRDRSIEEKVSQPFSIPRNESAKYIKKIAHYFEEIKNATFMKRHRFDEAFEKHIDPTPAKALRGLPDAEILKAIEKSIDNYLTARNNPDKYDFIGRDRKIDLGTFFYEFNENNDVLGVSHFLKYLSVELEEKNDSLGPERMLKTIYKKDLSKMYSVVYNQYRDFSDEEMLRMIKSILSLCRWWKRNESRLIKIYAGNFKLRFPKGMETFIEHYLSRFISDNKFQHAISLFPEKKHWKAFGDFIYDETNIDLEAEFKTEFKKDSGITISEIKKRMEAD